MMAFAESLRIRGQIFTRTSALGHFTERVHEMFWIEVLSDRPLNMCIVTKRMKLLPLTRNV